MIHRLHALTLCLAAALVACGSKPDVEGRDATPPPGEAAPAARPLGPSTTLSAADRAAVMRAAGFSAPRGDRWTWRDPDHPQTVCQDVWADVAEARDLDGDGRPEAMIQAESDACFGPDQRRVSVYTPAGSDWRQVVRFQETFANYRLYPRPGLAWPDIEIASGQTTGCVRFLRWNGSTYIDGGASNEGVVCTLTDAGRAAPGAA